MLMPIALMLLLLCVNIGYTYWSFKRQSKYFKTLDSAYNQIEYREWLLKEIDWLGIPIVGSRHFAASPDFLYELHRFLRAEQPKVIVEASSGLSTLICAKYAKKNHGHDPLVISLESSEKYTEITENKLKEESLSGYANVIHAPLVQQRDDQWYDIVKLKALLGAQKIDVLVIDGPPASENIMAREPAFKMLKDFLSPTAAIILDDSKRKGERKIISSWVSKYDLEIEQDLPTEKGTTVLRFRQV
ncbi:MAG: hypothetical protein CMD33_03180 [Flavobacteriales bacterium]|nr:hypothetical protein [Flavobacteriales bacterium]